MSILCKIGFHDYEIEEKHYRRPDIFGKVFLKECRRCGHKDCTPGLIGEEVFTGHRAESYYLRWKKEKGGED